MAGEILSGEANYETISTDNTQSSEVICMKTGDVCVFAQELAEGNKNLPAIRISEAYCKVTGDLGDCAAKQILTKLHGVIEHA